MNKSSSAWSIISEKLAKSKVYGFRTLPPLQKSKGNPLSGGVKCTEMEFFIINFTNTPSISKTVGDRPIYLL